MNEFNTNNYGTGNALSSVSSQLGGLSDDTIRLAISSVAGGVAGLFFVPIMSLGAYGMSVDLSLFNVTFGIDLYGYHVPGSFMGIAWLLLPIACALLSYYGDIRSAGKRAIGPMALNLLVFCAEVFANEYAAFIQVGVLGWIYVVANVAAIGLCIWSIVREQTGATKPATYATTSYGSAMGITVPTATTPVAPSAPRPAQAVRFCRNCGAKLDDGAAFCRNCGTRV